MPLLARSSPYDTWPELERAADARFWDALLLATGGSVHSTGAVYLLGYVVEMLVKTAYYRLRGVGPVTDVTTELRGIPARAALVIGSPWRGNLHDLVGLAELLVEERRVQGTPMDRQFAMEFQSRVVALSMEWSESLRYKRVVAREAETSNVYAHVMWIYDNYAMLWS